MALISQENLTLGTLVRNIKHGNIETILGKCLMKLENGDWVQGVIYVGADRFTGKNMTFVKQIDQFINEFEII